MALWRANDLRGGQGGQGGQRELTQTVIIIGIRFAVHQQKIFKIPPGRPGRPMPPDRLTA